jgi:hypothetical protein
MQKATAISTHVNAFMGEEPEEDPVVASAMAVIGLPAHALSGEAGAGEGRRRSGVGLAGRTVTRTSAIAAEG